MKRPSFQFYPSDWLRDTALRTCSIGARGLWIDMICFMHEGNPYGHLKVGNKVIQNANLASMVGASVLDVEGWLEELRLAGVYDTDEDGAIISRRMIRDENLRNIRAASGKLGGNPALKDKAKDKQNSTPSSSSSSSSSTNSVPNGTGAKAPLTPDEIIFGYGVPMLTNAGTPDKQARSFLGGLRKAHGDDEVVNALRGCIREKPLQPLEWLAKRLPPKGAPPKLNKQEALEKRNGDIGRAWAEKMLKGQNETVADS